jgi:hypothetical protein
MNFCIVEGGERKKSQVFICGMIVSDLKYVF